MFGYERRYTQILHDISDVTSISVDAKFVARRVSQERHDHAETCSHQKLTEFAAEVCENTHHHLNKHRKTVTTRQKSFSDRPTQTQPRITILTDTHVYSKRTHCAHASADGRTRLSVNTLGLSTDFLTNKAAVSRWRAEWTQMGLGKDMMNEVMVNWWCQTCRVGANSHTEIPIRKMKIARVRSPFHCNSNSQWTDPSKSLEFWREVLSPRSVTLWRQERDLSKCWSATVFSLLTSMRQATEKKKKQRKEETCRQTNRKTWLRLSSRCPRRIRNLVLEIRDDS